VLGVIKQAQRSKYNSADR